MKTPLKLSAKQDRQLRKHMKRFTRQNNRDHQQSNLNIQFMSNIHIELDAVDTLTWPCVEDIQAAQDQEFKDPPADMARGNKN